MWRTIVDAKLKDFLLEIGLEPTELKPPLPSLPGRPSTKPKLHNRTTGNTLYTQRAVYAMSQTDLAAKAGVSRRTIHAVEQNRSVPSVYVAIAIAEAIGLPVEEIFFLRKRRYHS